MILTRCPNCAKSFRVTPEQLKLRSGRVRCGHCRSAFDALASLVDLTSASAGPHPAGATEITPHGVQQLEAEQGSIGRPSPETSVGPQGARASQELAANSEKAEVALDRPEAPAADTTPPTPMASGLALETDSALADGHLSSATAAGSLDSGSAAAMVPAGATVDIPLAASPEPVASLDAILPAVPTPGSRNLRLLWGVGSIVALIALGAQAIYLFRGDIAHRIPSTRAWLDEACAHIGCTVPLPHLAELVSVEASELHPDPNDKGKLLLTTTLRNRAPFAQAYPHMELTLTDTRDQAVVRRVFAPLEYLGNDADLSSGFAANADKAVSLAMETTANGATGYRVYVFYP